MLRSVLLTSAVGLLAAGPALAQPYTGVNWTGPYAGVNLGYGGGSFDYPFTGTGDAAGTNPASGRFQERSSGIIGGGQAGYNFEMPNGVVLGLEADIDGTGIRGTNASAGADSLGNAISGGTRSQIDYLGTARGRLGYAVMGGRLVPYVTGGFAYGQVDSTNTLNCSTCSDSGGPLSNFTSSSAMRTGWAVGGGADYALTRRISMRVEYLHADLGNGPIAAGAGPYFTPPGNVYNAMLDERTKANLVRVGVNFRF